MTDSQQMWPARASRALESARVVLGDGDVEGCLNRAYYAAFYIARAALDGLGESPKTHTGTLSRFALRLVRTGQLDATIGGLLPRLFEVRQRADYDAVSLSDIRAAADVLADAERFVAAVRPLVT